MKRIAIIGAGLTGLLMARQLAQFHHVTIFEKARGVGGRMSARYAEPFVFDHGAQYITIRSPMFRELLQPFIHDGKIVEWPGTAIHITADGKRQNYHASDAYWVPSPNMNSLCKSIGEGLNIRTSCEVGELVRIDQERWNIQSKEGKPLGDFDWIISTAPPRQTVALFGDHLKRPHPLETKEMTGCYAVMIGLQRPWQEPWTMARLDTGPVQLIAVNSSKPGRDQSVTCLVAHSSHDWTQSRIDDDINAVQEEMLTHCLRVVGQDLKNVDYISTHRWRYAAVNDPSQTQPYCDSDLGLFAIGDWCFQSRVEDVALQAVDFAKTLLKKCQ